MAKRKRRAFTEEFKAETVRLIRESGKSIAVVARELGLTESAVRVWVRQAGIDAGHGPAGALTTEEREELGRLRRELRTVRMERDILKNQSGTAPTVPPVRRETGNAAMLSGALEAVAVSFMVIGSAKLCGVEPKAYLLQAVRAALANPGTVTLPHALLTN